MKFTDCFYLGHISKVKGYKGEVKIYLDVDSPEEYNGMESVFVAIDNNPVPFFIERMHLEQKGFATVKFEDCDDEATAKRIVGKELYLPLQVLPKLTGNKFYFHEVEGFMVIDENHGELGPVNRVLDLNQNPLLEVTKDYNDILIPINDEIIQSIDRKEKVLRISAPDGLIELYLGESPDEL